MTHVSAVRPAQGYMPREEAYMITTVTMRIEDELRDQIVEAAQLQGVTISRYIRDALAKIMQFELPEGAGSDGSDPDADNHNLSPLERRMRVQAHRPVLSAEGDLGDAYSTRTMRFKQSRFLRAGSSGTIRRSLLE